MNPQLVFTVISIYFGLLFFISWLTSRKLTGDTFFTGDRNSHWFLVSFGMIGASLSGVTFISVPGEVGNSNFYYFQVVLGYTLGYLTIAKVLLPLYYRLNLVSIYTFLENRFGFWSYRTGAFFFILSRSLGSSLRLYLVASVLQLILFDALGIPFWVSVLLTVALIWLYTFRGGIKTVVWTDTLQTAFMLTAVLVTLVLIGKELEISSLGDYVNTLVKDQRSTLFNWDWKAGTNFFKQFISGAFITIVMTGLVQDMMQKNLTCRTLGDAQKNMFWFTGILVVVNLLFLSLGVMLYLYAETKGIPIPERSDSLFPLLASTYFSPVAGIIFVLGIIAAAYSSVDSTLTALTTSFCYDFLQIDRNYPVEKRVAIRKQVHIGFTAFLYVLILAFYWLNDQSVINSVFILAGYTYGPLLGLFGFGLFTRLKTSDKAIPYIAILSPLLSFAIDKGVQYSFGYSFGYELLMLNGLFTFVGLWVFREKK